MEVRALLEQVEAAAGEGAAPEVALAYLATQSVSFDQDELRASRRRAMLVLAAGGDPRRELELDGGAVGVLATELDEPGRRGRLEDALEGLRREAAGLDAVSGALARLLADAELAWRWTCYALLAEELAED